MYFSFPLLSQFVSIQFEANGVWTRLRKHFPETVWSQPTLLGLFTLIYIALRVWKTYAVYSAAEYFCSASHNVAAISQGLIALSAFSVFLSLAAATGETVPGCVRLPGVPLALPAALTAHVQLPRCGGLVPANPGHQDQLQRSPHLVLRGLLWHLDARRLRIRQWRALYDLPRQPLF